MTKFETADDVLAHHGVKGMHWGQRKAVASVQNLGYVGKGFFSTGKSQKERDAISGIMAHTLNSTYGPKSSTLKDLNKINAKYSGRKLSDAEYKTYKKEYYAKLSEHASVHVPTGLHLHVGGNDQGSSYLIVGTPKGIAAAKKTFKLTHADAQDEYYEFALKEELDSEGLITRVSLSGSDLAQSDLNDEVEAFLAHHGVKGMKWGVRRYRGGVSTASKAGGQHHDKPDHALSEDHAAFLALRHKARTQGLHTLTNEEVRTLTNRAELQSKYYKTFPKPETKKAKVAHFFVHEVLIGTAKSAVKDVAKDKVRQALIKKGAIAAAKAATP